MIGAGKPPGVKIVDGFPEVKNIVGGGGSSSLQGEIAE